MLEPLVALLVPVFKLREYLPHFHLPVCSISQNGVPHVHSFINVPDGIRFCEAEQCRNGEDRICNFPCKYFFSVNISASERWRWLWRQLEVSRGLQHSQPAPEVWNKEFFYRLISQSLISEAWLKNSRTSRLYIQPGHNDGYNSTSRRSATHCHRV